MLEQKMIFPVTKLEPKTTEEFLRFWSAFYGDKNEEYYTSNISDPWAPKRIMELFYWKNGGNLSEQKKNTVNKHFIRNIDIVKALPKNTPAHDFLLRFNQGGPIWRIFFLHIWQPQKYPIYDQHVYRAMAFLKRSQVSEIPYRDRDKIDSYINEYLPFYENFKDRDRIVDKALWIFGKFLKSPIGNKIMKL